MDSILRRVCGVARLALWLYLLALVDRPWHELSGWLTPQVGWYARLATVVGFAVGLLPRRGTVRCGHALLVILSCYLVALSRGELFVWATTSAVTALLAGRDIVYAVRPLLFGRPVGTTGALREPDAEDNAISTFVVAPEIAIDRRPARETQQSSSTPDVRPQRRDPTTISRVSRRCRMP